MDEICPAEMTPSFLEAEMSIGCSRPKGHWGEHVGSAENVPVQLSDDWRVGKWRPADATVRIQWSEKSP